MNYECFDCGTPRVVMYPGKNPENGPAHLLCPKECEQKVPFRKTVFLVTLRTRKGQIKRVHVAHFTMGRAQNHVQNLQRGSKVLSCVIARGQVAPRQSWKNLEKELFQTGALR